MLTQHKNDIKSKNLQYVGYKSGKVEDQFFYCAGTRMRDVSRQPHGVTKGMMDVSTPRGNVLDDYFFVSFKSFSSRLTGNGKFNNAQRIRRIRGIFVEDKSEEMQYSAVDGVCDGTAGLRLDKFNITGLLAVDNKERLTSQANPQYRGFFLTLTACRGK